MKGAACKNGGKEAWQIHFISASVFRDHWGAMVWNINKGVLLMIS